MASGVTNKGKAYFGKAALRPDLVSVTTQLKAVYVTSSATLNADVNTFADVGSEIAAGSGYSSGGINITLDATGTPTVTEDDANDRADFTIRNMVLTASGGSIPASGGGARYIVITDDNGTLNSREVYAWFDLGSDRVAADGQSISATGFKIRIA